MITRQRFSFDRTVVVDANSLQKISVPGSLLHIFESTASFDFEFDDDGKNSGRAGMQIATGAEKFRTVTIYNRSATAPLTVELLIGFGSGEPGIKYDYLRTRQTKLVVAGNAGVYSLIPAGLIVSFPGIATNNVYYSVPGVPSGSRRRQFVVTNLSTANILSIYNSELKFLGELGVRSSATATPPAFTLETDADVSIVGTAGSPYLFTELFYV